MIKDKSYIIKQGYFCLSACISNNIQLENKDISWSDIILQGNGNIIRYDKEKQIIDSEIYKANFRFLEKYNIGYKYTNCKSEQEATNFLKFCIENELKISIKVSTKYLQYSPIFAQGIESSHFINIWGENEKCYYICDGYVPTMIPSKYEGYQLKESIIKAWCSRGFEYIILDNPINSVTNINKTEKIKQMKKSINQYLGNKVENGIYYGENSIVELIYDLSNYRNDYMFFDKVKNVNYQLKLYGFITLKQMLYECFENIQFEKDKLDDYKNVVNTWNGLCFLLTKLGILNDNNTYDKVKKYMNECILNERQVLLYFLQNY